MESFQPTNTVTMYQSNVTKQDGGLMILALLIFAKLNQLLITAQETDFQTSNGVIGNVMMVTRVAQQHLEQFAPLHVMMERMFTMHTVSEN